MFLFRILCIQIAIQVIDSSSNNSPQLIHTPSLYCSSGDCISVNSPTVSLTIGSPRNISFNITSPKNIELVNVYFESSCQLKPVQNESNIVIENGTVNFIIELEPAKLGHTVLHIYTSPISNLSIITEGFVLVDVRESSALTFFGEVIGWIYFVCWSISFYPQMFLNFRRKSVIGLHFDFLSLNVIGFLFYTIFNIGLYWIPSIQQEYFSKHPYGLIPVQINDVIFSLHALLACLFLVFQCLIYDKGDQAISGTAQSIIGAISTFTIVFLVLAFTNVLTMLQFFNFLSYTKLVVTLIKYIPQAYYNHVRRSTSGWSIGNILLDFSGGSLSILQMFILAYNYNDWSSIFGDFTKFGLGLVSMLFDLFFIVQHYVLYKNYNTYDQILPTTSTSDEHATFVRSDETYCSGDMETKQRSL